MQQKESPGKENLEEIYIKYVSAIKAYLLRLSGNPELAKDLTQEVFYRATRSLIAGKKIDYVSSWLFKIARNLYLDYVTRNRNQFDTAYDDQLLHPTEHWGEDPVLHYRQKELSQEIQNTLSKLPENQRTVLLLRDYHQLSYAEVATVMGLSISAVKSLLFRARLNFRHNFRD
ncbi:MAG: RNA polymerase sigma factor [Bacillota bacterium]